MPPPTVPSPLPCVGCGYDLVGLAEDSPCPECGVPIGRSVSGDHLFASAPDHRRRLARAAKLALWGAFAGWVTAASAAVGYALSEPAPFAGVLFLLPLCACLGLSGWGWVELARDDPEGVGMGDRKPPQDVGLLLVRLWGYLAICAAVLMGPVGVGIFLLGPRGTGLLMSAGVVAVGFGIPALALSGVLAGHVGTIARRLLEGELADRALGLPLAAYATLGLAGLGLLVDLMLGGGGWWLLSTTAWAAAAVALLAWGVIYHTIVRALRAALVTVAALP